MYINSICSSLIFSKFKLTCLPYCACHDLYLFVFQGIDQIKYKPDSGPEDVLSFKHYNSQEVGESKVKTGDCTLHSPAFQAYIMNTHVIV